MSKLLPPIVRKPLLKGLRSAFPDIGKFDSFLRTNLSKQRTDYVPDTTVLSFPGQIERVLLGAENEGWVEQLIDEACQEQTTNEDLRNAANLYEEYKSKSPIARAPEAFSAWIRNKTGLKISSGFLYSMLLRVGIISLASMLVLNHQQLTHYESSNLLMNPSAANTRAPERFNVEVSTTKGKFIIAVNRAWSPNGADRFYNLVEIGYFKDIGIYRAVKGFMLQFGIHGDPSVNEIWNEATVPDDPRNLEVSNLEGYVALAKSGHSNSRCVTLFVNLKDNPHLDDSGSLPIGKIIEGMDVVRQINTEYGEIGIDVQRRLIAEGNRFIEEEFPNLDYIKAIRLVAE